jgi:hypothetical protein
MGTASDTFETLLGELEAGIQQSRTPDAIDEILSSEPRKTKVKSLRDHEVIQQFRQELSEGLIRVDTAGHLLELLRTVFAAVAG